MTLFSTVSTSYDGSYKCLWSEACGLLSNENTKLRRRKRGMYRREGKQISRGDRQGASSKRANNSVAEHGRIWQVVCPSTVIKIILTGYASKCLYEILSNKKNA